MPSGNVAFTPVPPVVVHGKNSFPSGTKGSISPKGSSVERPATSKERLEEMKKIADILLRLPDKVINNFSPEEKKEYEDFLRDLLKSWQDHRMREIFTPKKSRKMRRRRNKTRKN
jgi:tyrosyl-tRNA synthetase